MKKIIFMMVLLVLISGCGKENQQENIISQDNNSNEIIGVYVEFVEENSPADKGGIKKGDKILKVEDVEVPNVTYFKHELYKYEVGEKITITVERDGKEREIDVKLGSQNPSA